MTDEELKLRKEELVELAGSMGAEIDNIVNSERQGGGSNQFQRFMMMHPIVMDVLKHVLQNPGLSDKLHGVFKQDWYESASTRRFLSPTDTEEPTAKEKQEELIQSVEACLAVCRKQVRLGHFFSDSPDKLALVNAVDSMGKILMRLRYAGMKELRLDFNRHHLFEQSMYDVGSYVAIRPCGEEYGHKTYLGILLGDFPMGVSYGPNEKERDVVDVQLSHGNPAMYVPALKKTIFGCESWWHKIKKPEDLKDISDEDINSVWYVQALKAIDEKKVQNNEKDNILQ